MIKNLTGREEDIMFYVLSLVEGVAKKDRTIDGTTYYCSLPYLTFTPDELKALRRALKKMY